MLRKLVSIMFTSMLSILIIGCGQGFVASPIDEISVSSSNQTVDETIIPVEPPTIPPVKPPITPSLDISFSSVSTVYNANKGTRGSAVGDLDNDGRDEFIADALKIFDWNGSSWDVYEVVSSAGLLDRFAGDGEVMDVDNDGFLDIIETDTTNSGNSGSLVWFKNPKGNLAGHWVKNTIYSWNGAGGNNIRHSEEEVGDIDGDGFMDIVVRGTTTGSWVFINKKNGYFYPPTFLPHNPREGLALADIDSDGDLDVIVNGVWFETPSDVVNGVYTMRVVRGMELWYPVGASTVELRDYAAKVRAADINMDGRVDIIISNSEELRGGSPSKPHGVHIFLQPADLVSDTWAIITLEPDHYSWHSLQVNDLNNDGSLDILASISTVGVDNAPFETKIWQGRGDGSFSAPQTIGNSAGYQGILGDYDGDGFLDYFLPNAYNSGPIRFYRNLTSQPQ